MPNDKKALRAQQLQQQNEYNQYSPQFGNIASWYAQNNPAASMFTPDWYYRAQAHNEGGLNGAEEQQNQLANQANKYDNISDQYDQFAGGVHGQLAEGNQRQQQSVDRQQGAATKQQGQADWLWNNPGYTDQEKQSMMTSAATPIAGSYTAAQGDLANQSARTGNSAAYGAGASDLARKKAQDLAMVGLQQQGQFANKRIEGQQFANQAQGAAGEAQGAVSGAQGAANQNAQAGAGLESNILNTGANIRQGGANIRTAAAGSNLQRSQTAQGSQNTMQGAQALSMAPANLAANMYGTIQGARGNTLNSQTQLGMQPSFLKQLALAGVQGASSIGAAMAGKPPGVGG